MLLFSRTNRIYRRLALAPAVLAVALSTAAVLPAAVPTEAPPPGQLVSQVSLLQTLDRLHLTAAQLREVVQRLDQYFHAQNQLDQHKEDAAKPVAAQLRRIKAALEAGDAPDPADQQQVNAALAGLKPEETQVARVRRETIDGIRQILNRTQIAMLRSATGTAGTAGPDRQQQQWTQFGQGVGGVTHERFRVIRPGAEGEPGADVAEPPAPRAPQAGDSQAGDSQAGDAQAGTPEPPKPETAAPDAPAPVPDAPQAAVPPAPAPPPVPVVSVEAVLPDTAPELPPTTPPVPTAAPPVTTTAAPVLVYTPALEDGLAGGQPVTMEQRMAQLEKRLDELEARLDKAKVPLLGDLPLMGPLFRTNGVQQNLQTGVMTAVPWNVNSYGGAWVGGATLDDDAIARIFLQPESLHFLRARAARG